MDSSNSSLQTLVLQLNRSKALFELGKLDAVLAVLDSTSNNPQNVEADFLEHHEAAIYLKCRALYHLHRYRECSDLLSVCCRTYPQNPHISELLREAINWLMEEKHGKYPFWEMQHNVLSSKAITLDHGTYVVRVEIRPTVDNGRGLFTTSNVNAGDLLLCEKAAVYFNPLRHPPGRMVYNENRGYPDGAKEISISTSELEQQIIQEMQRNPSRIAAFMDLYRGPSMNQESSPESMEAPPILSSFAVQEMVRYNMMRSPRRSTLETQLSPITDRLQGENSESNEPYEGPCGVWLMASYANHCCDFNASQSFIGDMIILRASKNLAANTEITIDYLPHKIGRRKQDPFEELGFECACNICRDVKATKVAALQLHRENLLEDIQGSIRSIREIMVNNEIEDIMQDIEILKDRTDEVAATYQKPASDVPRLSMLGVKFALASIFDEGNSAKNALVASFLCFDDLGFIFLVADTFERESPNYGRFIIETWGVMDFKLVRCWLIMARAYEKLEHYEFARSAMEHSKTFYKICVGEDETFEALSGNL